MEISEEAIQILITKFGAKLRHDSGHKKAPTLIYDFPNFGGYQLGIRKNKQKLTVYLNAKSRNGKSVENLLSTDAIIEKRYPQDGKPASSLLSEEFAKNLTPHRGQLLLIKVSLEAFSGLITNYLDANMGENQAAIKQSSLSSNSISSDASELRNSNNGSEDVSNISSQINPRSMTPNELQKILCIQKENGEAGELIALDEEKKRLRGCGCATPDNFVTHTSKENVAAGYDIHSNWNTDQERFIEVKTTSSKSDDFYMSKNEKQVLTEKAGKSYIYIVGLDSSEAKTGVLREAIKFDLSVFDFEPVNFRVRLKQ